MTATGAERQRKRWAKRTPEQIEARREYRQKYWQAYDADRRSARAEKWRSWWSSLTAEEKTLESIRYRALKYNLSKEEVAELLAKGCMFPADNHIGILHIDHDHSCCTGRKSCGKCVRGVLCARHNLLVGQFENIAPHLQWVVSYLAFAVREEDK
jgi:hypothetical protein